MESVVRYRSALISVLARISPACALVISLGAFAATTASAAPIEAIRGKTYPLTAKHGPWMIKVTSLWEESEHQELKVANELVYQLRKKGIPAYVHHQSEEQEQVESTDRLGRPRYRKMTAQHSMIAVLAGNYNSADDKKAKDTLAYIKKFKPNVTVEWKGKEVPVPLIVSTAFLIRNPLLSPEELARKNRDPFIVKLNSGVDHSLLENKGNFTLVVASFYGKSQVSPAKFEKFDNMLSDKSKISLDNAARDSWQLMTTLRNQGIDSYVYHDRFKSIVTVGAFKSPNDPDILRLIERYRAKEIVDPKTRKPTLVAESIQVPPTDIKGKKPSKGFGQGPKGWIMDPVPQLIDVPK
jgi:hypothetical protein